MRLLIAVFVLSITLAAQRPFLFGVKGGAVITHSTTGHARAEDRWYTLGPSVEFRLPRNFAVEFNPLYKRAGYTSINSDILGSFYLSRVRANTWEFPFLGKYYRGPFFVSGGYTARRSAASSDVYQVLRDPFGQVSVVINEKVGLDSGTEQGFAVGGGARLPLFGPLKITAEYRYSRWVTAELTSPRRGGSYGPTKNQHEILIGLVF